MKIRNTIIIIIGIGVLGMMAIVAYVGWLFLFSFSLLRIVKTDIVLLDTGEKLALGAVPVLGGDGARVWYVYSAGTDKHIGTVVSGEGFRQDDPTPLEVWAADSVGRPEDLLFYFKPATQELFKANNVCRITGDASEEYSDKDLGLALTIPKGMEKKITKGGDGSVGLELRGDVRWCSAVTLPIVIFVEKFGSKSSYPGLTSPIAIRDFLGRYQPGADLVENGNTKFFIVTKTIHGTVGGSSESTVWFVNEKGELYTISFNRYMNLGNVKVFLSSVRAEF